MKFRLFLTVLLIGGMLGGCRIRSAPSPAAVPTATFTFTLTPTQTFAPLTITPSPWPTSTLIPALTATITATPDPLRHTPPTLMLHRRSLSFDSVQFLKDFIVLLKQNKMHVITYEDIRKDPGITLREQGKLFIISIDDLYLRYPIEASVLEMITLLRQANYPAVLGVVTESNYLYPETISTYKELTMLGWEIASHTDRHSNLGIMERTAPRYVYTEVQTSVDKIEKAIGKRPYTLILPEGQMVNDPRFIKRALIAWIIGINGGVSYDSRKEIVYLGREGPDGTAEQTFKIMMGRFNP
jgi:peptidoglycan/xylan/chitin deacetylase (PgdA/CDA1 family)